MSGRERNPLPLQVGTAVGRDNLATVFCALEMGEPYSIILTYDARLAQPWGRVDMRRDIYSIVPDLQRTDPAYYYALSNVGDVYHVGPDGATREHIPGAGFPGQTPSAIGPVYTLAWAGGRLLALGSDNLVFRRDDNGWQDISPDLTGPQTHQKPSWGGLVELDAERMLLVGRARAIHPGETRGLDWARNGMPKMSMDEFLAVIAADEAANTAANPIDPLGLIVTTDGQNMELVPTVQKGGFSSVLRADDGTLWVTGKNGQVLHSRDGVSFEAIPADPNRSFGKMAQAPGGIAVISDQGLWLIADGAVQPLRPRIALADAAKMFAPASLSAVPDGLVVFDANHGVLFWDGDTWTALEIPPRLLEPADIPE